MEFHDLVISGEFDTLSVGERVRFDLDRTWSEVTAVRVLAEPVEPTGPLDLRYAGFNQEAGIRHYRFDGVLGGKIKRRFVVSANMALFRKYHIAVQDGPALCLRKLAAGLETTPESTRCELTSDDLLAQLEARAAASQKRRPKRLHGRSRIGTATHSP